MVDISGYMNDGANWQAQAVLAYIRAHSEDFKNEFPKGFRDKKISIEVGRVENTREQGYVFTLVVDYKQVKHYAVYEHRNWDNIVVFCFNGTFLNTPSVNAIYNIGKENERGKYDYDKNFTYGHIIDCGEWILSDMVVEVIKSIDI